MTPSLATAVQVEPGSRGRDATVKTVERVARLLQQLALAGDAGARITDLARDLALTKPTVHRLLAALAQVGMARHDTDTRRYRLGELTLMLGQSSARITVANDARQSLLRLAVATQDTVFVSVQEGTAAVCVGREIGSFPIRTLTLSVGDQRPLGVGAGSMALFAFLPDAEIEAAIARNKAWLASYPHFTPDFLREQVRQTRVRGYSLNQDQVIPGMSAIGVPAVCRGGRPIAALSVAGITERIAGPRQAQLVALLRAEADHLSSMFCKDAAHQSITGTSL
jgi:DNA-binding IclR family transcriptional regulator